MTDSTLRVTIGVILQFTGIGSMLKAGIGSMLKAQLLPACLGVLCVGHLEGVDLSERG